MACSAAEGAARYSVTARRNNSLSSSGRFLVFGFILVVSLGIALAFAYFGAWLILPFAGLEIGRHLTGGQRTEVALRLSMELRHRR